MPVVIIIGIGLILFGLSAIFMRDLHWDWHVWRMKSSGLTPERTPQWEKAQVVGGLLTVIMGIFVLVSPIIFWR